MIKVLAFGAFDDLTLGHGYFLAQAAKLGDYLIVVVGDDVSVKEHKHGILKYSVKKRVSDLKKTDMADKVRIGSLNHIHKVIIEEKPSKICLGFNQKKFEELIVNQLDDTTVKELDFISMDAFRPHIFREAIIHSLKDLH